MLDAEVLLMRTTLTIDDDVLRAAKQLARAERSSTGEVLSRLARRGLISRPAGDKRNGVILLPESESAVGATLEEVNALRDELI